MTIDFVSHSPSETISFAKKFLSERIELVAESSIVLLLNGPMGAGKTELTKGLAEACFIDQPILSPTYTIAREYLFHFQSKPCVFLHADLWRMQSADELKDTNLKAVIKNPAVVVVEWADMFSSEILELLRGVHAHVFVFSCRHGKKASERIISITSTD